MKNYFHSNKCIVIAAFIISNIASCASIKVKTLLLDDQFVRWENNGGIVQVNISPAGQLKKELESTRERLIGLRVDEVNGKPAHWIEKQVSPSPGSFYFCDLSNNIKCYKDEEGKYRLNGWGEQEFLVTLGSCYDVYIKIDGYNSWHRQRYGYVSSKQRICIDYEGKVNVMKHERVRGEWH